MVDPDEIHAGNTVVVPAMYGGIETDDTDEGREYGWNPSARQPVGDVGHKAACGFAGRRFAVRVAPGLLKENCTADSLAEAIARAGSRWRDLRDAVAGWVQTDVADALEKLNSAKRGRVEFDNDIYGEDDNERPRGVVFVAPLGIKNSEEDAPGSTEDDWAGSLPVFRQSLDEHTAEVERMASKFARRGGMPEPLIQDITLAAHLHDAGKADPRFQALLADGDPILPGSAFT
jgi:CRISPR-associated endonuclease/helicase Cas3